MIKFVKKHWKFILMVIAIISISVYNITKAVDENLTENEKFEIEQIVPQKGMFASPFVIACDCVNKLFCVGSTDIKSAIFEKKTPRYSKYPKKFFAINIMILKIYAIANPNSTIAFNGIKKIFPTAPATAFPKLLNQSTVYVPPLITTSAILSQNSVKNPKLIFLMDYCFYY